VFGAHCLTRPQASLSRHGPYPSQLVRLSVQWIYKVLGFSPVRLSPRHSDTMFKRAALVLLVTATLSLSSFAHAGPHPRSVKTITTIPLPKRSGLIRSDGVFDYAKAVHSIAAAKNKHRQNMINLERNKGRDAFLVVPFAIASFSS
jgi:hypothetical protein